MLDVMTHTWMDYLRLRLRLLLRFFTLPKLPNCTLTIILYARTTRYKLKRAILYAIIVY
jgi:hypothetical protein